MAYRPHFSRFSSVVSGTWSVLLHGNFSEETLWRPYTCLIGTLLLLRHFPPPLSSGPCHLYLSADSRWTWLGQECICKYFCFHSYPPQAHSFQLAQSTEILGDTVWPQQDVPEMFHSDIHALAREPHCPELCFMSFSSFGALDSEAWLCCTQFAL